MEDTSPHAMTSIWADGGTTGWSYAVDDRGAGIELDVKDLDGGWIYHVQGRLIDQRPAITSLSVEQRDSDSPKAITSAELRKAPIGVLLDRVRSAMQTPWEDRVKHVATQVRTHRPKEGRSRSAEHFIQVTWIYLSAQKRGAPPRQAVAEHWGVQPVTASRWIKESRKRQYLPTYRRSQQIPHDKSTPIDDLDTTRQIEFQIFAKVLIEVTEDNSEMRESALKLVRHLLGT